MRPRDAKRLKQGRAVEVRYTDKQVRNGAGEWLPAVFLHTCQRGPDSTCVVVRFPEARCNGVFEAKDVRLSREVKP
jgi:hypothetical protein